MLTIIFIVLLFAFIGKTLAFAIKAAWGLTKILCSVVFFPLVLIVLVLTGLLRLALPILVIVGIYMLIKEFGKA